MTRGGRNARLGVDRLEAQERLRKARAFHAVATASLQLLEARGLDRSPVVSNAILAAIAYVDAVTIAADGRMNQKDHATAPALLRQCLGNELPDGRYNELRSMLSIKDEIQYGARISAHDAALRALDQLDRFSAWAVAWLEAKGVA